MSLSFVDELQAQVERLEKEILEAEAAGKDREETGWRFRTSRH
jgi:hypothetical protein